MDDYFDELVSQLTQNHPEIDVPYLHGLMTGFATTPDADLEKLFPEIAEQRQYPETLRKEIVYVLDFISEDLSVNDFRARFRTDRDTEAAHWIQGYLKAVKIHDNQWRQENENHHEAGAALVILQSLVDEGLRQELNDERLGYPKLMEAPELVTDLALTIYQSIHGDTDGDVDIAASALPPLLAYPKETLSDMDENELFALVTGSNDRLPLEIVRTCADRAEAILPLLHRHLTSDDNWSDSVDEGDWWGLLHAVFILGLIPGKASARALLEAFRRITFDSNNNLADWLSGYWPALCRNKTEYITDPMIRIAEDRELDWYPRTHAAECVVAGASEGEPTRLEQTLDWLAALCADESQSPEFRVLAASCLLDLPRDRHRPLLENLLVLQDPETWLGNSFNFDDIDRAFVRGDTPGWKRFDNPWHFYDPSEIRRRQQRWIRENREQDRQDLNKWVPVETYVREQPKIGRNAPCPCGSGRKFKKCCMNKPNRSG